MIDRAALHHACGSTRWVEAMLAAPIADRAALHAAADRAFAQLDESDIREAMRHHPRIGDLKSASASDAREQAGAASADDAIKAALADGNRAYEARFGHIYLVCASGKSGQEMLDILRSRLEHDADTELRVAAAELLKITHLRLDKLWEQT